MLGGKSCGEINVNQMLYLFKMSFGRILIRGCTAPSRGWDVLKHYVFVFCFFVTVV